MGYYTSHPLRVFGFNDFTNIVTQEIESWTQEFQDIVQMISDRSGYGTPFDGESIKWYDYEKNMAQFSKSYPNHLFRLQGEGEESGDLWIEYYYMGKSQRCKAKIVYDDFKYGGLS